MPHSNCRSPSTQIGQCCNFEIERHVRGIFPGVWPDESLSNGLEALFEVTKRQWNAATVPNDEFLAPIGRVIEILSEQQCEGWLEGYLLTGRHGLFNCYEAFIDIVDSMFNQHTKWLKVTSAPAVAAEDLLVKLPAGLACLAPGS